jgi:hypothetical protein
MTWTRGRVIPYIRELPGKQYPNGTTPTFIALRSGVKSIHGDHMNHRDIVYFSLILFVALIALSHWKARRNRHAVRIKRGLQSYASGTGLMQEN